MAIPGQTYEASLTGEGAVVESAGSDIGVTDSSGRGWSAHYGYARGVTQAFSVGIARAPFTVSRDLDGARGGRHVLHAHGDRAAADRAPDPGRRRTAGAARSSRARGWCCAAAATGCACAALRWRRWNADVTVGHGRLGGRDATVTLSAPRACDTLDGFIYTRAKVAVSGGPTLRRVPIACPLPST